uniref:Uncharacterized protein n=1 Tax=Parascaris univalens TaxID=6257 RepID=A0A915BEX5_PARUN
MSIDPRILSDLVRSARSPTVFTSDFNKRLTDASPKSSSNVDSGIFSMSDI